jgi:hypothetical protein
MENKNEVLGMNEMVEVIIGDSDGLFEGETTTDLILTLRNERNQARRECDCLKKENDDLRERMRELEKSIAYWQTIVQNAVEVVNQAQNGVQQLELIAGGKINEAK